MLKPEHFSYKCPLQLSDLDKTDGGHFCAKCSKDIYDLSDCSIDEIIELQRRKGSICGFVRAVGLTSMVGLAACSDENASNDAQPDLIGEVDVLVDPVPAPEPPTPVEPDKSDKSDKASKDDDSTVTTDGKPPQKPAKPDILKPEVIEIDGPVLLGIVCPPEDLKPKEPEALDPHREGSPG